MRAQGGGLTYMAASAFFFAVMSLLVRLCGQTLPSSMIVFARAAVALVIAYALVKRAGLYPWGPQRRLLLTRGLFGFGALTCFYWSLTHMPLSEATVIQYMNPIFTALLAAIVLREAMRGVDVASVVISLVGVVLVAKPGVLFAKVPMAQPVAPSVVLIALLGAALSAAAYVAVRKSHGAVHPLVVVFWFPLLATPLSVPALVGSFVWPTWTELLLLVGVGVTTQAAQVFMTEGLHREPAGRATAMSYVQIVFATVLGAVFLKEIPDLLTLAGAALIGASVIMLALWPKPKPRTVAPSVE